MLRTVLLTFVAGAVALIVDSIIGAAAPYLTDAPPDFPPFTFLPILSGAFGGAILASLAYSLLRAFSKQPERMFFLLLLRLLPCPLRFHCG